MLSCVSALICLRSRTLLSCVHALLPALTSVALLCSIAPACAPVLMPGAMEHTSYVTALMPALTPSLTSFTLLCSCAHVCVKELFLLVFLRSCLRSRALLPCDPLLVPALKSVSLLFSCSCQRSRALFSWVPALLPALLALLSCVNIQSLLRSRACSPVFLRSCSRSQISHFSLVSN